MDFSHLSILEAPLIRTPPPGPMSQKYLNYQSLHDSSAVSYPKGMPMAIKRAKGATVEDVDGNIYIDFFGGAGVMNVGYSNPEVIKAVSKVLGNMTHALDFPNSSRQAL
ncbi:MAG: aminotransferase class III-fold pyridoxal phosphate-dependent enzyme, partial [Candidatus Aminicenantales bacterium]